MPGQSEDLAQRNHEIRHGIPQPALAEGPEEGEVLAHLRGGGAPASRERPRTDGLDALPLKLFQEPQIE